MTQPYVTIYTDGGARPNPGVGGWAALLQFGEHEKELSGAHPQTTNNRMELTAAIEALSALKQPCRVRLVTDSEYLKNGITQWIHNWRRKGFKDVKNPDLWQQLDALIQRHEIEWAWVRGHSGDAFNERVDQLATAARERLANPERAEAESQYPEAHITLVTTFSSKKKTGAFGGLITLTDAQREIQGRHRDITQNRLALLAAIAALEALGEQPHHVHLTLDVAYVVKGATGWIKAWLRRNWRTRDDEPVKNKDDWQGLHQLMQRHRIHWYELKRDVPDTPSVERARFLAKMAHHDD